MTDDHAPAVDTPRQLLSATHQLTRRVRDAQRGTWFPLALLGLVVLGAAPFYRVPAAPVQGAGFPNAHRLGSNLHASCHPVTTGRFSEIVCSVSSGWPTFIYWMVALVLAYVLIAGYYVFRASRRGVGARIRPYVMAGIAGLVIVIGSLWPVQRYLGNLPAHSPVDVIVHGLNPLLAIGVALFVLARVERSWALLVFAACNLAVDLLASLYDITRLLRDHGWTVPQQWVLLPGVLLAGGVLLLGSAGFAVAARLRK